ncbi:MAG: acetyl-CoA C-acyltransferase, partial [Burkholderiales bacterium]
MLAGVRTPIGRYGGALADVRPDDLAASVIAEAVRRAGVNAGEIEDVYFGCANQAGEDNRNVARMALLLAGLPDSVPGVTLNRLCASGLEAVGTAARAIRAGEMDFTIAGGVESMTRAPFVQGKAQEAFSRTAEIYDTTIGWRFVNPLMKQQYGIDSMPETGENVAEEFQVTRADQDGFAYRSQMRAAQAQASGYFAEEIVAVTIPGRKGEKHEVTTDEHPRADTTLERLASLKPVVRPGGTVTAGNSSGINDGASAVLLAYAEAAERLGLRPIARVVASAVAGVDPGYMGLGPIPATRKVLARAGLSITDTDAVEVNEAFAPVPLAWLAETEAEPVRLNPHGGAIALGHPLGGSGARIMTT